jgi:hypothetical protein
MSEHRERFVTQRAHQVDLILCHTALRIVAVIGQAFWFAAVAITAQIRRHDGEVLRQLGHDLVPDRVGLGMAMQQQQCGAVATLYCLDPDAIDGCRYVLEVIEHDCLQQFYEV